MTNIFYASLLTLPQQRRTRLSQTALIRDKRYRRSVYLLVHRHTNTNTTSLLSFLFSHKTKIVTFDTIQRNTISHANKNKQTSQQQRNVMKFSFPSFSLSLTLPVMAATLFSGAPSVSGIVAAPLVPKTCDELTTELIARNKGSTDGVTMQRAAKEYSDDCSRWEISYGDTRFYSVQDEPKGAGCENVPYADDERWTVGAPNDSSVDKDQFPTPNITSGPCGENPPLACSPLDIVHNLPYNKPQNTCPRVYCVEDADPRVAGEFWEDIDDFLRDGVPRYVRTEAQYGDYNCVPPTDCLGEIIVNSTVTLLNFTNSVVENNTLHLEGGELRYKDIGIVRDQDVSLVVTITSGNYTNIVDAWADKKPPKNSSDYQNGKKGQFGTINLQTVRGKPNLFAGKANELIKEGVCVVTPTLPPTLPPTTPPTTSPSESPTINPTTSPTNSPSSSPTTPPTTYPATSPSESPKIKPTTSPTSSPSSSPTTSPTKSPTINPTTSPTSSPSSSPTTPPSSNPSSVPSLKDAGAITTSDEEVVMNHKHDINTNSTTITTDAADSAMKYYEPVPATMNFSLRYPTGWQKPLDLDSVTGELHNARRAEAERDDCAKFSIHRNGFQLLENCPTDVDFSNVDEIQTRYYDEMEALVRQHIPEAEKVMVFDHKVRRGQGAEGAENDGLIAYPVGEAPMENVTQILGERDAVYRPFHLVHGDYSDAGARNRIRVMRNTPRRPLAVNIGGPHGGCQYTDIPIEKHLTHAESEAILNGEKRFLIVNVWRNRSKTSPIKRMPISFLDCQTVDDDQDMFLWTQRGPGNTAVYDGFDGDHANYIEASQGIDRKENHRWYYYPELKFEEALLFKTHDSYAREHNNNNKEEKLAHSCLHSVFVHPATKEDDPDRETIETRIVVVLPAPTN